jgi:hypothetical protein
MQGIIISLSLAVFWLCLGGTILIYEWLNGPLTYRPLNVSLGWWCLALSAYNWLRVARTWSSVKERQPAAPAESSLARRGPHKPEQPPDPNFQFTDSPAKPEDKPS